MTQSSIGIGLIGYGNIGKELYSYYRKAGGHARIARVARRNIRAPAPQAVKKIMARNAEDGGSVTVLATALVDTGSRMDDMIFEEFKGTGNSEIILDRALAEARVFPAINLQGTGTRRDDLLYSTEELDAVNKLRRWAMGLPPKKAIEDLRKLLQKFPTNEELLKSID